MRTTCRPFGRSTPLDVDADDALCALCGEPTRDPDD